MPQALEPQPILDILIEDADWNGAIEDLSNFLENIAKIVLEEFDIDNPQISILLCDDKKIQELNKNWRNKDAPTNVLSFPNPNHDFILGDIAIAKDYSAQEAELQKKEFKNHIAHLLVHGILHLLGYDHEDDIEAEEMESLEVQILQKAGISNPYLFEVL